MYRIKKFGLYAALVFALFYLFTRPVQAANAVSGAIEGVFTGADKVAVFFSSIDLGG
ncbi:hypothetical protein ABZ917_17135 [Nonomuraea wenchangensis]